VELIGGPITSDPTQYTYPLYFVDKATPMHPVRYRGLFSDVRSATDLARFGPSSPGFGPVNVPISDEMEAANGSDAQIIIVNPVTGDEWGFWQLRKGSDGAWTATNGYHYNVYWDGVPPRGFGSRGAGVPYFTGLVRPYEIARGRIDHALAFAFGGESWPRNTFVYPATKSDGASDDPRSLPEGARLQLDPAMTEAELRAAGCNTAGVIIARALQEYGMYVIDNSGSDKIIVEYQGTADWSGLGVDRNTARCIPLNRLRWVQ
jgi:hypothetical protein